MTTQATEAPGAPAQETPPAQPAAPAPPPPVPAPPPAPREPDGRFAPQPPAVPAQPQAPAAAADPTDWRAEAERLRAEAARARQEADQWKAQSRRQEARSKQNHAEAQGLEAVVRQIAEKLEVPFDDRPDPEILQKRLTEQTDRRRQSEVELAVLRQAAASTNVNIPTLLDSREFAARTAALDPDALDFHAQVADLVREAAGQPRYQFQQPPPPPPPPAPEAPVQQAPAQPPQPPAQTSGADFSGAPRPGNLWTQADYDNYMATSSRDDRDGKKLSAAIDAGLLAGLGIGRPKTRSRR